MSISTVKQADRVGRYNYGVDSAARNPPAPPEPPAPQKPPASHTPPAPHDTPTASGNPPATLLAPSPALTDFDRGVIVGLLIGEGSFGGDGKQPQVTLRMHTRHEAMFHWLMERFPDSRLYGPYHHGGRSYFQWMARGRTLVRDVLPLLEQELHPSLDGYAAQRLQTMCERYATFIARERDRAARLG